MHCLTKLVSARTSLKAVEPFRDGSSAGFELDGTRATQGVTLKESSVLNKAPTSSWAGRDLARPEMATSRAELLSTKIKQGEFRILSSQSFKATMIAKSSPSKITVFFPGKPRAFSSGPSKHNEKRFPAGVDAVPPSSLICAGMRGSHLDFPFPLL